MRKIPTLFVRDPRTRLVTEEVTPGCDWALAGEGRATKKLDGSCCLVRGGRLYKRHELRYRFATAADPEEGRVGVRDGKAEGYVPEVRVPEGFEPAAAFDPLTLKVPGWVPVGEGPEDRWHREAWYGLNSLYGVTLPNGPPALPPEADGTYELLGPKVQGNPEGYATHVLVAHGSEDLPDCPRDFAGLRGYLAAHDIEGVVFWRGGSDSEMCKIKGRDFGIRRSAAAAAARGR